ncbi:hypothetical protein SY83_16690 [Paenibacillus swuensis]|uniref:Xanthine dehydrogenase n=1 Tax=Paenibacillus swuensis TaxID=1178515 RepID=A0A172TKT2_9BACL|nr:XdhC family protein [Paenibacillus swuensis]ANE47648.1 hypothetical protein SY83_16690 [Paenibacillus swuensis]
MDSYQLLTNVTKYKDMPSVLATIVDVQGHAYRKAGASMLFRTTGESIGSISPGCLEADLAQRIDDVWNTGKHQFVDYNLHPEEDVIWGEAIGCGGKIRVLLEPVSGLLKSLLELAFAHMNHNRKLYLYREFYDDHIRYTSSLTAASSISSNLFETCFSPRERCIIFGAGDDAIPLQRILINLNFRVVIADWRAELCMPERFSEAEFIIGDSEYCVNRLKPRSGDYVYVGSHHYHHDRKVLELLTKMKLAYLGVLGSTKRVDMLFKGISRPDYVKAPAGISIGAEGAEEIAVSVASELILVRKQLMFQITGRDQDANSRLVHGSRGKQENGSAQAFFGIIPGY